MADILPANYLDDILPIYRGTPVALLLEYHNLGRALGSASVPQLLIGMCMDSRKALRIPNDFAFVLRTAGANMRDNEFRISYAIAVGGVHTIVLIAHTDCGMARLEERHEQFVNGMVKNAGWDRARAEQHFAESRAQVRHARRGGVRPSRGRPAARDLSEHSGRAVALPRGGRPAVSASPVAMIARRFGDRVRSRRFSALMALIVTGALVLGVRAVAYAHATLVSSEPKADSRLATSPTPGAARVQRAG